METSRWERLQRLFHAAAERPPAEREAFLAEACDDDALRREVLELLAHDEPLAPGTGVGEAVAAAARAAAPSHPADPWAGRSIGAYRVVRELGRGGMGVVLLAERADGAFERQVAVKLSLAGLAVGPLAERLESERRILAGLDHPAIARLLDGGTTADGAPYVVMELVEGRPIDSFCDEEQVDLRGRLELFVAVCDAVEHAHRRLVVHRDLKPSNILVTGDGQPKLLDFGIAKLLEPVETASGDAATRTMIRALTPEYASPEQLRGEPVTTASDVYALGVVLFELLAGRRPFQLETGTPAEAERVVLTRDPPRPSAVSRHEFRRGLGGDLDTIVLAALRKEPERRYPGARELAEDVRRYLAGRPVSARPSTLGYRVRRFAGRHRFGVGVAALALLAVAAALVFHTQRLASERDRAIQAAEKSEQIARYLEQLFVAGTPDEARGRETTALELLDRGAETIGTELASDPEVRADLLVVMANAYRTLAAYERSDALLDEAEELVAATEGERSPRFAEVLAARAALLAAQGEDDDATRLSERAVEILDAAPASEARAATALHNLASLRARAARHEEAAELAQRAHERRVALFGAEHPRTLASLSLLASAKATLGDTEDAYRLFEQVLDKQLAALGEDHSEVAETLSELAGIEEMRGDLPDAVERLERALAIRRQVFPARHPHLAVAMVNLSGILQEIDQFDRAEQLAREALSTFRDVHEPDHPHVALARERLAQVLGLQGRAAEALALQHESVESLRAHYGAEHPRYATALHNFGGLAYNAGAFDTARDVFNDVIALWTKIVGADHLNVAFAQAAQGKVLIELGETDRARRELEHAKRLAIEHVGPEHRIVASHLHHLGRAAIIAGDLPQARRELEQALAMRQRVLDDPVNLSLADTHHALGMLALAEQDWPAAEQAFDRALAMRREIHAGPHREIALSLAGRARARAAAGQATPAVADAHEAVAMAEELQAPPHELGLAFLALAEAHTAADEVDAAREARERAVALLKSAHPAHHPHVVAARELLH
jgi:serine/threonine-protein kinase